MMMVMMMVVPLTREYVVRIRVRFAVGSVHAHVHHHHSRNGKTNQLTTHCFGNSSAYCSTKSNKGGFIYIMIPESYTVSLIRHFTIVEGLSILSFWKNITKFYASKILVKKKLIGI